MGWDTLCFAFGTEPSLIVSLPFHASVSPKQNKNAIYSLSTIFEKCIRFVRKEVESVIVMPDLIQHPERNRLDPGSSPG